MIMDSYLEFLNTQKEELLNSLTSIDKEIEVYLDYQKYKAAQLATTSDIIPKKTFAATTAKKVDYIQSDATKTSFERVLDIIRNHNNEMYGSQIAEHLYDYYKGKDKDWVLRRVSSILSDEKNKPFLYCYSRREKGQHHLAKVWGLVEFKDKNGDVKEIHKYKSTL